MAFKVVIVFQQVTDAGVSDPALGLAGRQHIGSFSESLIINSSDASYVINRLTTPNATGPGLLPARAAFLCSNASILGVRLYENLTGKGTFRALGYPGTAGKGDVPQMALLAYMPLQGTTRTRRFTWRGLPDEVVVGGEFSSGNAYRGNIVAYGQALQNFAALGTGNVSSYKVATIDAAGLVSLDNAVPNPFPLGTVVSVQRTVKANGQSYSGNYIVTAAGTWPYQFVLGGWVPGACTGGSVKQKPNSQMFPMIGAPTVSRVVQRKVGRPFEPYRGRRSKRKRQ